MDATVVYRRNPGRSFRQLHAVKFGTNDAATYVVWIFNSNLVACDSIARAAMQVCDLVPVPVAGHARIDYQRVTAQFEPEDRFEPGAVMRTIEPNRFVTGVTWVDGELWHGTWEGDESDIRRINPESGAVLERLEMPRGTGVSGLESDGADLFYCGGGASGKVRAVRRPRGEEP